MYLIVIATFSVLIASLSLSFNAVKNADNPYHLNQSSIEFEQYRMFAYAMDQYVKANPFSSSTVTTLNWDSIKNASTTPVAMRNNRVPNTWVAKGNSSNWVICADLSEPTTASLKARVSIDKGSVLTSNNSYIVIGESDPSAALNLSNICAS